MTADPQPSPATQMTTEMPLADLLACPRCDRTPLVRGDGHFRCSPCRIDFADLGDIPCLFAEPNASRDEWRERFSRLLRQIVRDSEELESSLARNDLPAATRERLTLLRSAYSDHAARLQTVLAPLLATGPSGTYEFYLALKTRLPAEQGIASYYHNIHRDWVWGDTENAAARQIVERCAGSAPALGRTVLLGAGAGRLAYDLYAAGYCKSLIALEINPLLATIAQALARGQRLELYEFPLAPRRLEDHALLRSLAAPAAVDEGLVFVLADALRAPLAAQSFDTVVTPWFIDIVPEKFATLSARINRLLKPGGRWINFGSLSFHHAAIRERLSLPECMETLESAGFAAGATHDTEIPYMCSPASRHGRRETVLSWVALKQREAGRVPKFSALPDWIVRGTEPIPLSPALQAQAASTRIYAFLMAQIDGRRSLKDIAQVLIAQRLMSPEEAEPALRSFLIKMYEDSQRALNY